MRAALPSALTSALCFFNFPLPDLAALRLGAHHRVADLALEGLGELRHVRERAVDAEAAQGVLVTLRDEALVLRRGLLGPDLRPPQEEALLRREAVDVGGPGLAGERLLEGVVGDREAPEVGD